MRNQDLIQLTRISRSEYYDVIAQLQSRLKSELIAPQIPPEKLTKKLAENLITNSETPPPDCLTCGVCCSIALSVPVSFEDPTPDEFFWELMLDDSASEIVVGRSLKRTDTKCNYLGGNLCENVACQIYDVRPDACRAFEPGSDRCHAYRRMFGIEPELTEQEFAEAEIKLRTNLFDEKITFVLITEKEVTQKIAMTAEGFSSENLTTLLQITAFLGDDETPHIIHHFDPHNEAWLEDDFLSLTLEQAQDLISDRNKN